MTVKMMNTTLHVVLCRMQRKKEGIAEKIAKNKPKSALRQNPFQKRLINKTVCGSTVMESLDKIWIEKNMQK